MSSACRRRRREIIGDIPLTGRRTTRSRVEAGAIRIQAPGRPSDASRSWSSSTRRSTSLDARTSACIAVEGEPGIGKTHLLAELRRRAEERGSSSSRGAATEFEREVPFGVWADALDAYVASQELDLDEHWSAELVAELGEILPSSRRAERGARPARSPTSATARTGPPGSCSSSSRGTGRSSSCSTTCTGATRHRSSCSRRSCAAARMRRSSSRSRSVPGRRRRASRRRSRRRRCAGSRSSPSTEAQATELLAGRRSASRRSDLSPRRRQPLLPRAAQAGGRGGTLEAVPAERGGAVAVAGMPVPSAVAASLAEELASLPAKELVLLRAAAVAGEPFEPDLAAAIAELRAVGRARRTGRAARARPRPHDAGAAPVRLSPPPRAACGLRVGARPAGGSAHTRARRPRWRRGARPRPSAPTTSSSTQGGRRGGDRADARRRSRRGGAGAGRGGALVRVGAAPAARRRRRAPGGRARCPRVVAALRRGARPLPGRAARGASSSFRRTRSRGGSS